MSKKSPMLLVPLVTPLAPDGGIDLSLLAEHGAALLREGANGLVLFGTLGEGQSFSVAERMTALEAMLKHGISAERLMVGTGAAALPDAVALSRHAASQGCMRQLLLPPFFFKGVQDEGLFNFFAAVIGQTRNPDIRLFLYDIPSVVSIAIPRKVTERLIARFGTIIAGIKDSVADWDHIKENLEAFPQLSVFVGNEIYLPQALALGGAGAVSGLGNFAAAQMAEIATGRAGQGSAAFECMQALYHAIARHPVIPTVKALTARKTDKPAFGVPRPPLSPVDPETDKVLLRALGAFLDTTGSVAGDTGRL